jgi:hypothetical protein
MTIAQYFIDPMSGGAHVYSPDGPFGTAGNFPLPSFKPGQVVIGDGESEIVYVLYAVPAAVTWNQGDFFCWDNSYNAGPVGEIIAASEYFPGEAVGTLFLGGQVPQLQASIPGAIPGNIWSFTFQPGVYGVWMQRYGTSLMNLGALSTGATLTNPNTTATKGRITMAASVAATTFSSAPVGSICNCPLSRTFTANTVNGSAVLTAVNTPKYLVKGMQVTGTGIPAVGAAQPGTFILDIQGSTITLSQLCTSTNTGSTITALNSQTTGNAVNGSKQITNVPSIPGLYPNQIITGTGVVSLTIQSIMGGPGNYTINLTTAASATNNNVQITLAAAGTNFYFEGFLRGPFFNIAL